MALVSGVFLLVLANRSPHRALAGEARQANPWMVRMAAAVVVLLVAVNLVPWLRNIMGFAAPDATGLGRRSRLAHRDRRVALDGASRHGLAPGTRSKDCPVTRRRAHAPFSRIFIIKSALPQRRMVTTCYRFRNDSLATASRSL